MSSKNANVCLLSGNLSDRKDVVEKIRSQLGESDVSVFDNEYSEQFVEQEILTPSLFGKTRLFHMKEWPAPRSTRDTMLKRLARALSSVPDNNVVILDNLSLRSKVFLEKVKKVGKVFEFPQHVSLAEASQRFVGMMGKYDKKIELGYAGIAAESLEIKDNKKGVDLDRLHMLAKKLDDYTGGHKTVKSADVEAVIDLNVEFIVWRLYDAIDDRKYGTCLKMVNNLCCNSNYVEKEVIQLLHGMIWRYRLMIFLKEGLSDGRDPNQLKREAASLVKLKREGMGDRIIMSPDVDKSEKPKMIYSEKMVDMMMRESYGRPSPLKKYQRPQLYRILQAIDTALPVIRSGCEDAKVLWLLDMILMVACGIVPYGKLAPSFRVNDSRFV